MENSYRLQARAIFISYSIPYSITHTIYSVVSPEAHNSYCTPSIEYYELGREYFTRRNIHYTEGRGVCNNSFITCYTESLS